MFVLLSHLSDGLSRRSSPNCVTCNELLLVFETRHLQWIVEANTTLAYPHPIYAWAVLICTVFIFMRGAWNVWVGWCWTMCGRKAKYVCLYWRGRKWVTKLNSEVCRFKKLPSLTTVTLWHTYFVVVVLFCVS